ncbi:precorrin-6A synthase (deacetylating) [Pseudomonas matsuisoli]|uniref:Precorrin-6A synthase (Deacetylating) n=1 Tax=Pseudomonas matsuisoli TaxID=1515666 RepID=A0A917UTT8_9PSED|nr:precorrin-6A synthase (deacetylating) [Pseudomonas matsuisoli]GGJ85035.1 precorrin-6A synthase (deacetylating) [Pseudomonas matsuisoli]
MKQILIIGIGAGDPDHLTRQAIKAMNRADAFFLMDKGPSKGTLIDHRRRLCEEVIDGTDYRFIEGDCPERIRNVPNYRSSVDDLNQDKREVFEWMIDEQLADGECGAFLVWGDPALYDSTIRIVADIAAAGRLAIDYEVIPGISSLQALAARHKVCFNSIGNAFQVMPARRLAEQGFPEALDSVLVMLDARDTYTGFVGQGLTIYWGAYVGSADEVLIAGALDEVAESIRDARRELREKHGWIMDSYLLRRGAAD